MKITRTYKTLLRFYPADYRTRFAAEMLNTFMEANACCRKQCLLRRLKFVLMELRSLLIGAAAEWMAKLTTDASVRGRSLPDLRMMRPPGVTRESWFAKCSSDTSR